jgi:hypothetical protein
MSDTPDLDTALVRDAADEFCDGPYAASGVLGDHRSLLSWAADEIDGLRAEVERLKQPCKCGHPGWACE